MKIRPLIFPLLAAMISTLAAQSQTPAIEPSNPVIIEAVGEKETKWKPRETWPLASWPGAEAVPPDAGFSKYGGLASRAYKATGFFRVEKIGGRWKLIDPEGCEFYNAAVSSVRPLEGRAAREALMKKFGDNAQWACAAADLLRSGSFNASGAWSSDDLLSQCPKRPVYTKIWNFMFEFGKLRRGWLCFIIFISHYTADNIWFK